MVQALLAAPGINVNNVDDRGISALMMAAAAGHTETVKALLAAPGIDVNTSIIERFGYPLKNAEIALLISKHESSKKIGNLIKKTLIPHVLFRPPNPEIPGDKGGREYRELVKSWEEREAAAAATERAREPKKEEKDNRKGGRVRITKKTIKYKRTKKLRKYRRTLRKLTKNKKR
jgi:hypothetical protein